MSVSLSTVGIFEPLTYLIIVLIDVACAFYLVKRYFENREKLTWLFITFFAVIAVCFSVNLLIITDVLYLNLRMTMVYTYLIGATIVAVIGLVMLGVKQLYALPPLLTVLAFIHQISVDTNHAQTVNAIQILSYNYTGQFIGDPWFIALKIIFPNFAPTGLQTSAILNLLYDPLALPPTLILGPYLAAIAFPTTILFYILAWKNRSGRSLGFSLGLTTNIIIGFLTITSIAPRDLINLLTLIAAVFFALGIFGVFDKLMKKETKKNR